VEPCSQENTIKEIKSDALTAKDKLHEMEVRQVEIQGDVKHIKTRIDNGMSHTIHNLDQTLTKLTPIIEHHSDIVKRIEGIGWTLSTALILTVVGLIGWAITKGFQLPS
jgi:hypothetical protein